MHRPLLSASTGALFGQNGRDGARLYSLSRYQVSRGRQRLERLSGAPLTTSVVVATSNLTLPHGARAARDRRCFLKWFPTLEVGSSSIEQIRSLDGRQAKRNPSQ